MNVETISVLIVFISLAPGHIRCYSVIHFVEFKDKYVETWIRLAQVVHFLLHGCLLHQFTLNYYLRIPYKILEISLNSVKINHLKLPCMF